MVKYGQVQYKEAQDAIRRIAKEGRKYGVGLGLISQAHPMLKAQYFLSVILGLFLGCPTLVLKSMYRGFYLTA